MFKGLSFCSFLDGKPSKAFKATIRCFYHPMWSSVLNITEINSGPHSPHKFTIVTSKVFANHTAYLLHNKRTMVMHYSINSIYLFSKCNWVLIIYYSLLDYLWEKSCIKIKGLMHGDTTHLHEIFLLKSTMNLFQQYFHQLKVNSKAWTRALVIGFIYYYYLL